MLENIPICFNNFEIFMVLDAKNVERQAGSTNKSESISFSRVNVDDSQGIIAWFSWIRSTTSFAIDQHHFLGPLVFHRDC